MQHPCNPPQKPRTMATVSPLHQVVPPQPNLPSFEGANLAFNATSRTSSFAAALRKLAKQAVDPVSGEKDLTQISPVSSPVLSQGSLTPKRSVSNSQPPPPAMFLTNHQVSYASSSPPVMTIAPSRPVATHTSESRKVMDLSNVQSVNNSNVLSNGHLQDSLGVKMDSSKNVNRSSHSEKWDESNLPNKGLSGSTASSQSRPHATIAPLPRPDDSLTSSRGFQPYRGTEESRNTLPHHLSLFDHPHPAASYPYTPAFLPPPHLSHPAYRFDDPSVSGAIQSSPTPVMPYPQPGMMTPSAFYPNSRYAADLLAQSLSISSANNTILNHERLKQEEERRMREKEIELDQSRSKEQERQREKEQKEKENREREQKEREQREKEKKEREKSHREREEHKKHNTNYSTSSKRTESPNVRNAPVIQCAPPTVNNHISIPNTVSNPIPLNLVVQASPEPLKKEAEIWTPWQQPSTNYPKENNNQEFAKHPAFRSQEVHRHHASKDNSTSDKVNMRFSPSSTNDKRHSSIQITDPPTPIVDAKKHSTPDNTKRFDTIHHHITELSSKEHVQHEWRHEKLQKACTNNHRKSHESKKAKEDRNNVYQNHQRKVVANGAILKPTPFQNEGMHARLLESEKCRLEMNGHALPKTHTTNAINDRLVPPNFKPNHQPVTGKEIVPQKPFNDFYSAPSLKSNVDLAPVVSKLDLDAKNLKKGDMKYCEDDAKEELRMKNFLIITKVPPKKFESNPQQLKFLQLLGLTTHFKRKKIEFDMYLKRRKILREDSAIPPLSPEPEPEDAPVLPSLMENNAQNDRLAEQLRAETNPIKLEFLFKIGLTPITLVKKEEKERIRRIVEEERIRRHYRMLANVNRKSSPRRLFVPKSEAAQKLDHLRRLKEMNSVSNGLVSRHLNGEAAEDKMDVKYTPSNSLLTPKLEQVPYHCSSESSESLNSSSVSASLELVDSSYSSQQNNNKSFNKFSFKRGHSLKHEFRFATPDSNHKNNHITRPNDPTSAAIAGNCSVSTQVDPGVFSNHADKSLADLKNPFNWPGLEAIMEAFYRHQNEQSSEKTVIIERCHHLRQTQEELKMEADGLSRQMSDLLRCKRELDDERQKHQNAIDHLKQCLQIGR